MNTPVGLAILAVLMFGINTAFWAVVGSIRAALHGMRRRFYGAHVSASIRPRPFAVPTVVQVAVLIAAHNEGEVIVDSIRSALRLVKASQVFVVSDGSSDDTAVQARLTGAAVLELSPNRGKAGALAAGIEYFHLAESFKVVLLLDADTELDLDYFKTGLPMFSAPDVAAVAGRAATQWRPEELSLVGRAVVAHRERIYVLVQRLVKYGQAAEAIDAVTIAPGFASMYRASVFSSVEMNPPGVVIEDFNMTFEIHRHRLGRIAFHPGAAVARTQDPDRLADYAKQVHRWALGFWQTVRLHRPFHRGVFWWVLGMYCCELILSCVVLLATALVIAVDGVLLALRSLGLAVKLPDFIPPTSTLLLIVLIPDLVLTCVVALGQRRLLILAAAPAFPLLRLVDSWLCLSSLLASFRTTSNGRWQSPTRRVSTSDDPPELREQTQLIANGGTR